MLTIDEVVSHEVKLTPGRLSFIFDMLTTPRHCESVAHGEAGNVILVVDASESILVLECRPGEVATINISTGNEGNLLSSSELRSKRFRLLISVLIDAEVDCDTVSILFGSEDSQRIHHFRKIEETRK